MKSDMNRRRFIKKSVGLMGAMLIGFDSSKLFNYQDKNPEDIEIMIQRVSEEIYQMSKGRKDMSRAYIEIVEKLPEKERKVLILYCYEDLSLQEIGNIVSLTKHQVPQVLSKAVLRIKSKLLKRFA